MKKPIALLTGLALLAMAGGLLWLGHGSDAAPSPAVTGASTPPAAAIPPVSTPADTSPPEPSPPASFEVDASGHLKITQGLRQIFDFFLGTTSGAAADDPVALTHRYIQAHLQEPAAAEAAHIFDSYVAYLQAVDERQLNPTDSPAPVNAELASGVKIQQREALQARLLNPDIAQVFYGDENAIARYRLSRQQILQMNGLSKAQKEEQLATLLQQLPPSAQKTVQDSDTEVASQQ